MTENDFRYHLSERVKGRVSLSVPDFIPFISGYDTRSQEVIDQERARCPSLDEQDPVWLTFVEGVERKREIASNMRMIVGGLAGLAVVVGTVIYSSK